MVTDGEVYFGSTDGHLYAVDAATGKLLWRYETGGGGYSSPTVADGVVYVGSSSIDGHPYALDAATGKLLWRYEAGGRVYSSPTVADGVVYVGSDDGHLYALDAATGETALAVLDWLLGGVAHGSRWRGVRRITGRQCVCGKGLWEWEGGLRRKFTVPPVRESRE